MTDYTSLIEVEGASSTGYGANRWIPEKGDDKYKVVVGSHPENCFVQIRDKDGGEHYVYISRDEMMAVGIACIQAAKGTSDAES